MKAIILAAGQGTRLRPLTDDKPKGLVPLCGTSLLERQRKVFSQCGVTDILVVSGYRADQIQARGFETRLNPKFATTNMVSSLFAAEEFFDGSTDVIVSYGDIVFEPKVLKALLAAQDDFAVTVDDNWHALWSLRQEDPLNDAETMKIENGRIIELGKKPKSLAEIQAQYMGLFRIKAQLLPRVRDFYYSLPRDGRYDGKDLDNMFMTSFLQLLISSGWKLAPVRVKGGWLEIDSVSDLEMYERIEREGKLVPFLDLRVV